MLILTISQSLTLINSVHLSLISINLVLPYLWNICRNTNSRDQKSYSLERNPQ